MDPLNAPLLERLRCPDTGQRLRPLSEQEMQTLRERVDAGQLRSLTGQPITQAPAHGLMRQDEQRIYPVGRFALLLSTDAIAWTQDH